MAGARPEAVRRGVAAPRDRHPAAVAAAFAGADEERVLAVLEACIEAYRPGATVDEVRRHVAEMMKRRGLEQGPELRGGFGHGVGLSTHDVPLGPVLREGMVFAIEPGLYFPEKNIGIRIEDTVLITRDGCEVLTKDVPKKIEEIEALLASR